MTKPLSVERLESDVVVLTLDLHERRNAMTAELTEAWASAIGAIRADPSVRTVVVTGAGSTFCAGGDLGWIDSTVQSSESLGALRSRMSAFYQTWLAIRSLAIPSIAAVNGPAIGAGLCLALACDLRFASPNATFSVPFASLGVHPGMAATWLLPEAIGMPRAREMFLTGRAVSAVEAMQWGLVSDVHDDVVGHAVQVADTIVAADAMSVELTRAALAHPHRSFAEGLDWESFAQPVTMTQRSSAEPVLRRGNERAP